jgi:hypothetical protein
VGRKLTHAPETPLTAEELQRLVLRRLPGPEQKILRVPLGSYPHPISNDDLARLAGCELGGGAFNNPLGRLQTMGLIEYPGKGQVVAISGSNREPARVVNRSGNFLPTD